jgi:hypothetical protein
MTNESIKATDYIVYVGATADRMERIYHTTRDLNEARTVAQDIAKNERPGDEVYIATRISTFRAETVVKEL